MKREIITINGVKYITLIDDDKNIATIAPATEKEIKENINNKKVDK